MKGLTLVIAALTALSSAAFAVGDVGPTFEDTLAQTIQQTGSSVKQQMANFGQRGGGGGRGGGGWGPRPGPRPGPWPGPRPNPGPRPGPRPPVPNGWRPHPGPGSWNGWGHPGWGTGRWAYNGGRWLWWGWAPWAITAGVACDAYYANSYQNCSNAAWQNNATCLDNCAAVGSPDGCSEQCTAETQNAVQSCEFSYDNYWNCGVPVVWPPVGVVIRIP